MSKQKMNVVEDYTFADGTTDMRVFPYTNKATALAAIPLHYEQFICLVKLCGWKVVEGCCEDDHAWLSTDHGDHFKIRLVED